MCGCKVLVHRGHGTETGEKCTSSTLKSVLLIMKVDLIGHSAGGWLGRAFIGDPRYFPKNSSTSSLAGDAIGPSAGSQEVTQNLLSEIVRVLLALVQGLQGKGPRDSSSIAPPSRIPNPRVRSLVTLGTPQRPVPKDKGQDRTGGALSWVHTTYPGGYVVGAHTLRGWVTVDASTGLSSFQPMGVIHTIRNLTCPSKDALLIYTGAYFPEVRYVSVAGRTVGLRRREHGRGV